MTFSRLFFGMILFSSTCMASSDELLAPGPILQSPQLKNQAPLAPTTPFLILSGLEAKRFLLMSEIEDLSSQKQTLTADVAALLSQGEALRVENERLRSKKYDIQDEIRRKKDRRDHSSYGGGGHDLFGMGYDY
jgi:FtsZ-binding cell division protein ZapB